jgi:hypothetical protein
MTKRRLRVLSSGVSSSPSCLACAVTSFRYLSMQKHQLEKRKNYVRTFQQPHLKGKVSRDGFRAFSVHSCLYRTCLEVFFYFCGLLITKVRCTFPHMALWENAPNVLMRLLLLCTMHFSYKLGLDLLPSPPPPFSSPNNRLVG